MSNNLNDPRQFTYSNQGAPPADPYAYYRPAPTPNKQPKTLKIPKVLIPFLMAGLWTLCASPWAPTSGVFLAAVFVIGLIVACVWIKRKVVASSPKDLRLVGTTINEFPGADFYEFERYTTELQRLGFVYQTDYRTHTTKPGHPAGIARVMLHPEHRCFAEINQLNNQGNVLKVHCSFMSYSLRQKDGQLAIQWWLSTTNRELISAGYAIRQPWSYAKSIPGAGPRQLLESHLSQRVHLVAETGTQVADDISCETYFYLMQKTIDDRRKMLKKKNILALLLQIDLFEFRPRSEWSGKPAQG